jgi:6-phosphogluconolactonase
MRAKEASLLLSKIFVLIMLMLAAATEASETPARQYLVYAGTYTDHGSKGIYAARFDASSGKLTSLGLAAESIEPSFITVDARGKFLYAVNETATYDNQPTGAVSAFSINRTTGKLDSLNRVSSRDDGPAHITLDQTGKFALVSNYTLGSVAVFPLLADGRLGESSSLVRHHGSSVNLERQAGPHAHAVVLSPDNRFAVVADLGLDQLLTYPFDDAKGTLGAKPAVTKTTAGAGPRHLVFGSDGRFLYVINEMKSTVATYSYDATSGTLHELQTVSTLPTGFKGNNDAAEIDIDRAGNFLFASNRGDDSIAVFAIDPRGGTLTIVEIDATGGRTPRNFTIDPTGSWLLAANQDSNDITVFHIDRKTGHLTRSAETLKIPSPVCLKFVTPE